MERLISLLGLVVFVALAWVIGERRKSIDLRIVTGGLLLQFGLALFIFKTPIGAAVFQVVGYFFESLLGFVDAGTSLVFGEEYVHHFFAFKVLPTIIFFSSLMFVLYHLGLFQKVVEAFAWVMRRTLGTSGAETVSAAANVFVGQTEAPLIVGPYVESMTKSELMALMVGGFATIAGGVMAAYVSMGVDAVHLLAASVVSAPAALLVAKLMIPETEQSPTMGHVSVQVEKKHANVVHAASEGALEGLKLTLNVAAMLIAVLALVALVNAVLSATGGWVGGLFGYDNWDWSMSNIFGYVFAPFAWLMGIPWIDALHAGELMGMKMVFNEFIAYTQMIEWQQPGSGVELSERSTLILTYALCGFANFGSIGIQIGGIGGIAPKRRADLARLGIRAMIGGTLAMMMTACVAGILL
ncbi:MAG: NupC/NupG family nucleoside CNT transporter [Bacteroidetes bacterium SB0662_bin_6]|nr:NupC/NupG family nucleoside CNT transporter [Bacteroidetes bacterium SB0668_bin_1]MYE03701.1 NupC/NupG family nucleoside CNT transporter [Bacteroidetes bacterium SB0662_bin_6]